ncbi:hypothetical protein [Treponema sp.]|uniref:hypothetical protein n=1 Tax=Treponema sp. TaxID=166 RepID=UPI00388F0795
MEEKMNIIAEAVYKACAETGFSSEFNRSEYTVSVNFGCGDDYWSVDIGISGSRKGSGRVYEHGGKVRFVNLDEALRLITEGFRAEGVVFNATAA